MIAKAIDTLTEKLSTVQQQTPYTHTLYTPYTPYTPESRDIKGGQGDIYFKKIYISSQSYV